MNDQKQQVLRARARALAREELSKSAPEGSFEVVEFVLSGEQYGVENALVREVYPLKDLTPLPCTPAFVLGIINLRGQILAVMDLRRFFDLPVKGITDLNKVIVLQAGEVQVGILADAVVGMRSVAIDDLQPPLPTMTGIRAEYLRGVTSDRMAVLDAARILGDEKIVVHDEVEA
jgi:purine-binding chemotaxis protein CheW